MHLQCALCHPFQTCYTLTCRGPTSALRKHLRTKHPEALTEIEEAALALPPSSPERVNVEAPLGSLSPDENWQRQDVQSKQGSLLDLGSDLWNLVAGATSAAEDTSNGESCPTSPFGSDANYSLPATATDLKEHTSKARKFGAGFGWNTVRSAAVRAAEATQREAEEMELPPAWSLFGAHWNPRSKKMRIVKEEDQKRHC